jgi:hypothetical protein
MRFMACGIEQARYLVNQLFDIKRDFDRLFGIAVSAQVSAALAMLAA